MATDLLTTAAVGATTIEADAMPHRLLHLFPHPVLSLWGWLASGGAVVAVVNQDNALAFAAAAVAIGTVVAQPLMRLYKAARDAKLEADTREFDAWDGKLSTKSAELGETKGRLKYAEEQLEELKSRLAQYEAKVDGYPARTAKTIKTAVARAVEEKVDATVQPAIDAVKSRVEAVEIHTGSTSGFELPVTPVPPEPKPKA